MSEKNWIDSFIKSPEPKKVEEINTKTTKFDNGDIQYVKTVQHKGIETIKGVKISGDTDNKTTVDTMRKQGFKNNEISAAIGLSDSRASQIAHMKKAITRVKDEPKLIPAIEFLDDEIIYNVRNDKNNN